ncbi:MAG: hypothetical protein J5682_03055 [Prevotella sp.]|nr:hypothetical protein [Prevotella sp.]
MKRLSHITIAIAILTMMLFGSSGIGWQRCSCTGKVSLLLTHHSGCCKTGSPCMKLSFTHLSAADIQTDGSHLPIMASLDMPLVITNVHFSPFLDIIQVSRPIDWGPPGWVESRNMVMRV